MYGFAHDQLQALRRWLRAKLWYLHCLHTKNTPILQWAIDASIPPTLKRVTMMFVRTSIISLNKNKK